MDDTRLHEFFTQPEQTYHRQYEALRAVFVEGRSQKEVAERFGYGNRTRNGQITTWNVGADGLWFGLGIVRWGCFVSVRRRNGGGARRFRFGPAVDLHLGVALQGQIGGTVLLG